MADLNTRTKDLLMDYQARKQGISHHKKDEMESPMIALDRALKRLDETCERHPDVHLRELSGRIACPVCQREKVKEQEREMVEKANKAYTKRRTYERLKYDSILTDLTLEDASFQNFDTPDEETKRNKEKARKIAGRYLKGETFNTLFTGSPGAGKSHLAMSILKAVNEHSDPWRRCLFVSVPELLLQIRSTFGQNERGGETEHSLIGYVAEVDLLVLDDLGAETGFIGTNKTASDFTQRVLYALMNQRQGKSTIITTNMNSSQAEDMYDRKVLSRLYRKVGENIIKFETEEDRRLTY